MKLTEYHKKRDFKVTTEPKGAVAAQEGRAFVIQKHAARNLHYDFRLELGGVLKSWAVPKGPSLNPKTKRLAMQVEDHPVDYGAFEGIIPKGEYGGGTVMVWDRGHWEPLGDPVKDYEEGKLKFRLFGEKLSGAWMLVRTRGVKGKPQWLLFKERDEFATDNDNITDEMDKSVRTGRTLEEIARAKDWVWTSADKKDKPSQKTRTHKAPSVSTNGFKFEPSKNLFEGVRLTSPDKILYAEQGISKLDLAVYYRTIAEWMLPYLEDRPLVLVRCPEGLKKECFYQKHPAVGSPPSLEQFPIKEKTKTKNYLIANNVEGLISLAQIGALEVHVWGSRKDRIENPDQIIFDLDPDPTVPWNDVVQSAFQVREFLDALGLISFVKTTGGKGLHLVVPIARRHDWDEAKEFCHQVALAIVKADPDRYTANMLKVQRAGKIYLDYLRNGRGSTAIAPYSTRARPGAPVSMPLSWEELSTKIHSDRFHIGNAHKRLSELKRDPWEDFRKTKQTLSGAIKKLKSLL